MPRRRVPTKEEVVAAGYAPEVAESIVSREEKLAAEDAGQCPVFTLRADSPRAVRVLMAALQEMPDAGAEGQELLRAFELYEEANR